MNLFKKLKQKSYSNKASNLIKQGDFEKAFEFIKKISSKEEQLNAITGGLVMHVIDKKGYTEIIITKDKQEYEQFQSIIGTRSPMKYVFYDNPKTGKIEGLAELIEEVIPKDNILLRYIETL